MASAQFRYVVGLVSDPGSRIHSPTFTKSAGLLKDFLNAHDGKLIGFFQQNEETFPEYAVVDMTRRVELALHALCVSMLRDETQTPFISRLIGEMFDINLAQDGMTIHPPHIPYYAENTA